MGYDLYWVKPGGEEAATSPQMTFEDGDSGDAERGDTADPGYFRLNIWAMTETLTVMFSAGMITEFRWPRFPKPAAFGLADEPEHYDSNGDEVIYAPGSPEARYVSSYNEVFRRDSGTTIPGFKLGTNDGWLVTPDEIRKSLIAYDRWCGDNGISSGTALLSEDAGDLVELQWWDDWIEWLKKAADHGGFYVY